MLERVHRKILRTIQGLPLRCHSKEEDEDEDNGQNLEISFMDNM